MTPVDQRVFVDDNPDGHGDCQRACVASMLDMAYEDVPDFTAHPNEPNDPLADEWGHRWWREQRRWLAAQGMDCTAVEGEALLEVLHGTWVRNDWDDYVIVGGPSPRGAFDHAVVGYFDGRARPGERLRLAHDPHPSREFLAGEPNALDVILPYQGWPLPPDEPKEDA